MTIETVALKLPRKQWKCHDINPDRTCYADDYMRHVLYITRIYFRYGTPDPELIGRYVDCLSGSPVHVGHTASVPLVWGLHHRVECNVPRPKLVAGSAKSRVRYFVRPKRATFPPAGGKGSVLSSIYDAKVAADRPHVFTHF